MAWNGHISGIIHPKSLNFNNKLEKINNAWLWAPEHQQEFDKIKELITHSPTLVHFDPRKPITLSCNASKNAIGAVILHDKQPIAFVSKSLMESQQAYAQIEKELYAICFGCSRSEQFLYGSKIIVETDHKPLISNFNKNINSIPSRLQRMMLKLQKYDLDVRYDIKLENIYTLLMLLAEPQLIQHAKNLLNNKLKFIR